MKGKKEMGKTIEFEKNDYRLKKVRFCISAWSKNDALSIRVKSFPIKLENGTMIVTDGNRLHIAKGFPDKPDGFYKVVKNTEVLVVLKELDLEETENKRFPDIDSVLPDKSKDPIWNGIKVNGLSYASKCYTKIVRKMSDNTTINFEYLKDVLSSEVYFNISQYREEGPIIFENDNCFALIMPMYI